MSALISKFGKSARSAAYAAVAGIMMTGAAMAQSTPSCDLVPGWVSAINTYCATATGTGNLCSSGIQANLQACCPASPAGSEVSCLCTALKAVNQSKLTAAGVTYTCPAP